MVASVNGNDTIGGSYGEAKIARQEKAQDKAGVQSLMPPVQPSDVATNVSDVGLPYLTPDAMMIYCQSRLTSVDSQCREMMSKQQKNGASQAALGELLTTLSKYQEGFDTEGDAGNVGRLKELDTAYAKAIAQVGADTPLGQTLAKDRAATLDQGDDRVNKGDIASLTNTVKSQQSSLNSDSEIDMIRLQSLMSQRQTAVQLTTNIVQSLNDQVNKIVANIGH
jgi:hypothetical protein